MLWAPQRTAISTPWVAANRTAACTSASSTHLATASGRRSMAAFQTFRASSYAGSAASTTSPWKPALRSAIGAFAVCVIDVPFSRRVPRGAPR